MSLSTLSLRQSDTSTYQSTNLPNSNHHINHGEESDDSDSDSETNGFSFTELLCKMEETDEDICLAEHGYKKISNLCNTSQGQLFKAETTDLCTNADHRTFVAIKRTKKKLHEQNISIQDGISSCIGNDCVKEAKILKHLTVDNQTIGNTIACYIDSFESENYFYLVMEHLDMCTLKQFVQKSHESIKDGKLSRAKYLKIVKYIVWQVAVTVQWLHNVFKCTHLDLSLESIMVTESKNGCVSIKICSFGVAEFFDDDQFECVKQGLTINEEAYISPQIRNNDIYSASKSDIWAIGMIVYECIKGERLYKVEDMWDKPQNAYLALTTGSLKQYFLLNNSVKYFKKESLALLNSLLTMNETNRLNSSQLIQHEYFKTYYRRSYRKLNSKINNDKKLKHNQSTCIDCYCM